MKAQLLLVFEMHSLSNFYGSSQWKNSNEKNSYFTVYSCELTFSIVSEYSRFKLKFKLATKGSKELPSIRYERK